MGINGFADLDQAIGLLQDLCAGAQQICDGQFWKIGGDDLLAVGQGLERLARIVYAAQVHLAGEVDLQGLAGPRGCSRTADLLRQALAIHPGDASMRVKTARAVQPQDLPSGAEAPTVLPDVAAALDAGDLGAGQIGVILTAMNDIPAPISAKQRRDCETYLVTQGGIHDPVLLRKIADRLLDTLDPDGDLDPDTDPAARAELHFGTRNRRTGLTPITGKLDDLGAATVRTAIDGLAAPHPEAGGVKDTRPAATRRAHALVEALRLFLASGSGPTQGGEQPHLTVTLEWDVINHRAQLGHVDGMRLSASQTRLLLCDAKIIPAVLGGNGEVMDVGRASYTFPTGIKRAIRLRDRGCVWAGCSRPAPWTEIHHINWWERDLGVTSLGNGCCLCAYHHHQVHQGQWQLRMAPDGRPELVPPKWIDPHQQPRRNTVHQL